MTNVVLGLEDFIADRHPFGPESFCFSPGDVAILWMVAKSIAHHH